MTKPNKLLWSFLVISLIFAGIFVPTKIFKPSSSAQASQYLQKLNTEDILLAVNEIRIQNNLPILKNNFLLTKAAQNKSKDMMDNQFFAHDGPNKKWASYIFEAGYKYKLIGENLATGYYESSQLVNAWINSETHKKNILSPDFLETGLAVIYGTYKGKDTVFIVQTFGEAAKDL
jgi:uncharacterized protein YkwD